MDDNNSATEKSMQEVTSDIEAKLFGGEAPETEDVPGAEEDVVLEDAEELPEGDDTESEDEEDSEGEELESIATEEELSLADYLGIDEERLIIGDDGQVSFNAVIDGETKQVPLKDLASSYQLQGHVNNKSMALETERKQFEEQRETIANELRTRFEGMDKLSQALEQQLVGEYQSIDWDRLRVEDPTEWTALRQEYAERAQKVQNMQGLVKEEGKRLAEEAQQKQMQEHQAYLQAELGKMIQKHPEWADKEKLDAAQTEIKSFLNASYGFTDEEATLVTDHRLVDLILDAKAYREGQKKVAAKKEKRVPKFQKPGATQKNATQLANARKVKAKKAAVKKSGHVTDVANLLVDRM
jgi:hypothetical protein